MTKPTRICLVCGAGIDHRHKLAKVCSDECAHARDVEYMRIYNAKLRADAEYCERERTKRRAAYRRVPPKVPNCVVCGSRIGQHIDPKATVCSAECRHDLTLANQRRWKRENRDKTSAYAKRYAEKNPEKLREKSRRYEQQNRDKRNAISRAWKAKNKPHLNAYQKARRNADPDQYREYSRRRYAEHADEIREAARLYREQNREKVTAARRDKYIRDRAAVELVKDLGLIDLAKQHGAENETGKTV